MLAGQPLVIRDLGEGFWDQVDSIDSQSLQSLVTFVGAHLRSVRRVNLELLVDGQRLDVDLLPLNTRTKNALCRHFGDSRLPQRTTVWELLGIRAFGLRSLLEFACVVEATQSSPKSIVSLLKNRESPPKRIKSPRKRIKSPRIRIESTFQSDASNFFQALGAWAAGEQQFDEISSALPEARREWPAEIHRLWQRVGAANARSLAGDMLQRYSVPALVTQWVNGLDDRQAHILKARILITDKPETLESLGERYGVTRERVRQIEKKTTRLLAQLSSAEYSPVIRRAKDLREKLGTVVPENDDVLAEALSQVVADFGSSDLGHLAQELFLWLAGPYKKRNGWLTADSGIVNKSKETLLSYETDHAPITEHDSCAALNELGIRELHHHAWVNRLKEFKRVDGGLLCLTGNILDKAERLLIYFDRPMTADELVDLTGSSSVRSLRQRLMDDERFWRINKQNQFVVAGADGYDEYTGITDEIIQELESCGGTATVDHLVAKITKTYGVKPTSVLAYLSTPLFVRSESNLVRVRENEEVRIATDISRTAGCYQMKGKWAWRAKVDSQLMRGSGRLFPNAFARELGCELGDKIKVGSAFGNITVSWPTGSTTGAALGSIRAALKGLRAAVGDYVFVIAQSGQIQFELLRQKQLATESAIVKLARLVGVLYTKDSENLLPRIADALCIEQGNEPLQQRIRDALLERGEHELCNLIETPTLSTDQYLDRIGSMLGRA